MSNHNWSMVDTKTVCAACGIKQSDVGSHLESPYCEKTPEGIEYRERAEYQQLTTAHDCGRQAGIDFFKVNQKR